MAEDTTNGRTLVLERVFDAPVEKLWAAWTEPEQISKWWGPKDFGSPAADNKIDLRVGGKCILCMLTPEGQKTYSGGIYQEIVPHKKIVITDNFMDAEGNVISATAYGMPADFPHEMLVTVTFEDLDGKTKLTIKHEGLPEGEMSDMTSAGWNESLDKLVDSLK